MPSPLDPYDKNQSIDDIHNVNAPAIESDGKLEYVDQSGNIQTVATESFVTNRIGKIDTCYVATTENLNATYNNGTSGVGATLTATEGYTTESYTLNIDGITNVGLGSRVLVKNQTNNFENGIYEVTTQGVSITTPWVLTRVPAFDSPSQMFQGVTAPVLSGTLNSVSSWMLTSVVTAVGTDAISFARLSKSGIDNVLGTAAQISVSVVNNVATISIATNPVLPGDTTIDSTGYLKLPVGTTAERPSAPATGMLRFNTSL